jgi:hypothetical protein
MPQRAKFIEEKKAGAVNRVTRHRVRRRATANDHVASVEPPAATGDPAATILSALNSLAIVPSAVLGEASSSNLADGAPVSPPIPRPEIPDLLVSADELDNRLSDAFEQLEGSRLIAG